MRIKFDPAVPTDRHTELRRIIRTGFEEADGPDTEVHVRPNLPIPLVLIPCGNPEHDVRHDANRPPGVGRLHLPEHAPPRAHVARPGSHARRLATAHHTQSHALTYDQPHAFAGRAYPTPPKRAQVAASTRWFARLAIPTRLTDDAYPYTWSYHRARTAGETTLTSWREHLLHLAAHEARHLIQYLRDLPASEVDAENWARATLRRHRHAHTP